MRIAASNSFYTPRFFVLGELFPREVLTILQQRGVTPWWLMDSRVLWTADRLRERFGPLLCNTWSWGGPHEYRGFRPFGCGVGADYGQHYFGRALDLDPQQCTAEEVRMDMRTNPDLEAYQYLRGVENGVDWLHIDVGNRPGSEIYFFDA